MHEDEAELIIPEGAQIPTEFPPYVRVDALVCKAVFRWQSEAASA
jgi:hypothetical protein